MSKADKIRHLRALSCEGCYKDCRYSKFRAFKGKSKRGGGMFAQAMELLRDESEDPRKWRYKRKCTLLGYLHEKKTEEWERMTRACSWDRAEIAARAPLVLFVARSANRKTGAIPTSMTERSTCPLSCPWLRGGCYADGGKASLWWNRIGDVGLNWNDFLSRVAGLPRGQVWRHNVAGDLPGSGDQLDRGALGMLAEANGGRCGFTYTHKPLLEDGDLEAVRSANLAGFTVNLSADSPDAADKLADLEAGPVVMVLPLGVRWDATPAGRPIVVCPAVRGLTKCERCRLCARADRAEVVGFPAHGSRRYDVSARIKNDFLHLQLKLPI